LNICRTSEFLQEILKEISVEEFSETVFQVIRKSNYNFLNMFEQRVTAHPEKPLFVDMSKENRPIAHSYLQIQTHVKEIAAFFHKQKETPRIALFLENSVEGACTDSACLMYDIFVTPLNVHFNKENLVFIFNQTDVNIVVTDTKERFEIVKSAIEECGKKIKIAVTQKDTYADTKADFFIAEECKKLNSAEIETILSNRKKFSLRAVATVMYTSGSTGMPKGVAFSIYNIVSKRFARGIAVPEIGQDEVMLSYLPLFHTFGRFLELTGTVFWGGTYVFAGNQSSATLMSLFPKINPSIFISIPLRWVQLYENCVKATESTVIESEKEKTVRLHTGNSLKWGLSAAGFLEPKIFRFFQKYGIELCSGFGMTEATGGITMTPPKHYREATTGIPLPGMKTRLGNLDELEIKSHYLGRYFENISQPQQIPFPDKDDYWFSTGDVFRIDDDGFHEIIDRVKDIYKNNKGQTVAPGLIENKFADVPGIKRCFLAGDGRAFNVLLIVPDETDSILMSMNSETNRDEYFRQIITAANKDLTPYERIVNYAELKTDFSEERDELTAKGSLKRKNIEKNHSDLIEKLYRNNAVILNFEDFEIIIPRRVFIDLAILETDLILYSNGIFNRQNGKTLILKKNQETDHLQIGDLEYFIENKKADLGILFNQPLLWAGNPALPNFAVCRLNTETPLKNFSHEVRLPKIRTVKDENYFDTVKQSPDKDFNYINYLLFCALHGDSELILSTLKQIETIISECDTRKLEIIRRRLETLSEHEDENIRVFAYRILLMNDPDSASGSAFPAFIRSGKSFLNEDSIRKIAQSEIGNRHLQSLRRRLLAYRRNLRWTASEKMRSQFISIFELLLNFAVNHPENYSSVRAEFAAWTEFKKDSVLAAQAEIYFNKLYEKLEEKFNRIYKPIEKEKLLTKIIFDEFVLENEKNSLLERISGTNFLAFSVMLIFGETGFDIESLPEKSIWISILQSFHAAQHFRISINTKNEKHFDIHVVIDKNIPTPTGQKILHRYIAMDGYPTGISPLPRFGSCDPKSEIVSYRYVNRLTAWEKLRVLSEKQNNFKVIEKTNDWRKLYIRSLSAFYKAWNHSGRLFLPGAVSPHNVLVPEADFSDNCTIISLTAGRETKYFCDLICEMDLNFYKMPAAHYPAIKKFLNPSWIFHAGVEALGTESAILIFKQMLSELLILKQSDSNLISIYETLEKYTNDFSDHHYLPLALFNASDQFTDWLKINPSADSSAKQQTISELIELYQLKKYPDLIRYHFYRETYFADFNNNVKKSFDKMLLKLDENPAINLSFLTELSDLQAVLPKKKDRDVLIHMIFPKASSEKRIDFIKAEHKTKSDLFVKSTLIDKKQTEYIMREPLEASEVGESYKLFFKENFPKEISPDDRHFIVVDSDEKIVAALCYRLTENNIAFLDGTVVSSPLQGRGIASAMIEDFFLRMSVLKVKTIKAHFLLGNYYLKHNFRVDKKQGVLVKDLV
jgi:long-subunit acyl-CoA synthetase (AMP-forming)/predicted GNAT family acetyltransferase